MKIKPKIKFEKHSIFPAIFTACAITIFAFMLLSHNISSFNRIISIATASDFDISKLTKNLLALTAIFVFTFGISYLFFNHLRTKHSNQNLASFWQFFDRFSIIASIAVILILISAFFIKESTDKSTAILTPTFFILLIYFVALILYLLLNLKTKIKFSAYQKLIITTLISSFAICVAAPRLLSYLNLIQAGLTAFCVFLVKFIKIKPSLLDSFFSGFVLIFSVFPAFLSIYIETLNILNQHEIFITNPLLIYRIILCLIIIIAIIASFIIHKKHFKLDNWQKFVYPALVIGIAMLSIQLPLIGNYDADIFESANYSVLISDFFNFGKLPIVEHYGGHMLSQFFGGIFYGILNGDFTGAIYSPYTAYFNVIIYTIAYFFIAKITDRDTAILTTIALPFTLYNFYYFGLGFIVIFSLLYYFKKPNLRSAFLVDLCLFICLLYRLDLGVAFTISAIVASIIYAIFKKQSLKKIIISSIIFAIIILAVWFIICGIKGLDGFTQIKQFIAMSASNQNWAFPMFEKSSEFVFAWAYIVLPIIMASSLLYIIFTKAREKIDAKIWLILLTLGIAYFANFTRGIVRHNVTGLPNTTHAIFWTAYIYLAILITAFKKNPLYFVPSYMAFTIFDFIIISSTLASINLATPIDEIPKHAAIITTDHKVNRIHIDPVIESELDQIKTFTSPFLNSDETFFDFTNRSLAYSYQGVLDPIYGAQTPGHLNGDFTSETAISDLSKNHVKLILMPNDKNVHISQELDSIPNSLRYYKLSEYIYQNFTPLLKFDTGEIWIATDSYQDSLKIAKNLCEDSSNSCQILHKNIKSAETYNLVNVPILWGEKDSKNASSNPQLTEATISSDQKYYTFKTDFDKSSGNYLKVTIDSENKHEGKLSLGDYHDSKFLSAANYTFLIEPGNHTYLFRVSHDEDWYNSTINAAELSEPNSKITILKGD